MFCKKCGENISPECSLTNNMCVFCYYDVDEWESNNEIITKKEAIVDCKQSLNSYIKYCKVSIKSAQNTLELIKPFSIGSIQQKNRGNNSYYYFAYRDGDKVKWDYLGKRIEKNFEEKIRKKHKIKRKIEEKIKEIERILYQLREIKRPSTNYNRFKIFKRDNYTCQYCGRKAPEVRLEVDHIIPVSKSGTDKRQNLKTACEQCNREKNNIKVN